MRVRVIWRILRILEAANPGLSKVMHALRRRCLIQFNHFHYLPVWVFVETRLFQPTTVRFSLCSEGGVTQH